MDQFIIDSFSASDIRASLPLTIALKDFLSTNTEIRIKVQMDDYKYSSFLFFNQESGRQFELSIKGKPGFCLAALHNLVLQAGQEKIPLNQLDLLQMRANEDYEGDLDIPLGDLFKKKETVSIDLKSRSHMINNYLFGKTECGAKLSINISGKPGFSALAGGQIRSSAPSLLKMISAIFADGAIT